MADLLENWHLPLTDFMQRVETYYGLDSRLKLDRDSVVTRQPLRVAEWHLYGSSRLGIYKTQDTLRTVDLSLVYKLSDINLTPTQTLTKKEFYSFDSTYTHQRGDKLYEGSNHLGNVLVTFSDKRLATCTEGQVHYQADVRSATDYAAFHALLDDRQWYSTTDSAFYRYGGSNGQEKDDEIYGTGNSYSAEFWQYDPRLGRRWNVDPKQAPWESGYVCFRNSPLNFQDIRGDSSVIAPGFPALSFQDLNLVFNQLHNAILEYRFNIGVNTALNWGRDDRDNEDDQKVANRSLNHIKTNGRLKTFQNAVTIELNNGSKINAIITVVINDGSDNVIDLVVKKSAGGYLLSYGTGGYIFKSKKRINGRSEIAFFQFATDKDAKIYEDYVYQAELNGMLEGAKQLDNGENGNRYTKYMKENFPKAFQKIQSFRRVSTKTVEGDKNLKLDHNPK